MIKPLARAEFLTLLAAGLVSSCSPHAVQTKRRDRIRIALDGDPTTLNMLLGEDNNTFATGLLIDSFLLRADGNGNLIPDLAAQVPSLRNGGISRDGRTIRYELRSDALWHDGAPVTAEDVAFTFGLVNQPDLNVPDRSGFDRIADVRVLSRHSLEVRLREAYSPDVGTFFAISANQPYPILPKHLLAGVKDLNHAAYNRQPVGCGPYMVREWRHGDVVHLERFERYFRGAPLTRYIDMRVAPSNDALVGLWRDGELDVAGLTGERELLDTFLRWTDAQVHLYRRNTFEYLLFQHQSPILKDEVVRRALCAAIDRERIMKNALGPFYVQAEGDHLQGTFGSDSGLHQQPFNPSVAEDLLEASGWHRRGNQRFKDGRPLELVMVFSTAHFTHQVAVQIQQALGKVAVDLTLKQFPPSVLYAAPPIGIAPSGRFDLLVGGWSPGGIADTSYLYRCDMIPPRGQNFSRICDPAIDQAARLEIGAVDPRLQNLGDVQIQRALLAHSHILFLGFLGGAIATRKGLEGFKPSPIVRTYWNPWEWQWQS